MELLLETFILKNKILILDSRENFVWTSMQEIIPSIVETWQEYSKINNCELDIINVDKIHYPSLLKSSLNADYIVLTCFNQNIAKATKIIKEKFSVDAPIIFYVHGFASIACWPFLEWGFDNFLNHRDKFVVTCEKDIKQLKMSLNTENIFKIPFYIKDLESESNVSKRKSGINFYSISRISEQKNIKALIRVIKRLKDETSSSPELHIFGGEDHLGSPNMGIESKDHLKELQAYCEQNGVDNNIIFHGFVKREEIEKFLVFESNYFISSSVHSDENFGVSIFRALTRGHQCILSDWGGHSDYKRSFPRQVNYIDTFIEDSGPRIDEDKLFQLMKSALVNPAKDVQKFRPKYYELSSISDLIKEMVEAKDNPEFEITELARDIYKNRMKFKTEVGLTSCKIFSGYDDQNCKRIYENYAGRLECEG